MKCRLIGYFSKLVLVAGLCSGQTAGPASPSHSIRINLPPEVFSQSFFIRYVLTGEDLAAGYSRYPASPRMSSLTSLFHLPTYEEYLD